MPQPVRWDYISVQNLPKQTCKRPLNSRIARAKQPFKNVVVTTRPSFESWICHSLPYLCKGCCNGRFTVGLYHEDSRHLQCGRFSNSKTIQNPKYIVSFEGMTCCANDPMVSLFCQLSAPSWSNGWLHQTASAANSLPRVQLTRGTTWIHVEDTKTYKNNICGESACQILRASPALHLPGSKLAVWYSRCWTVKLCLKYVPPFAFAFISTVTFCLSLCSWPLAIIWQISAGATCVMGKWANDRIAAGNILQILDWFALAWLPGCLVF